MLQIDNDSPLAASLTVVADEEGVDCLTVSIKATFEIHPDLQLASEQRPIEFADRLVDPPHGALVAVPGELGLPRPGTDVLMHGHAIAPAGRPTTKGAVSLSVGQRRLVAAIFGDRTWDRLGNISDPLPWQRMPLSWARAFGGSPPDLPKRDAEAALGNPAGVGLDGRAGAPVPNFEDPQALLTGRGDRPRPVGFGPIAPSWEPRRRFAGTYDARWARTRAPYLPADFDRRFLHVAPPELRFQTPLQGGEAIESIGVSERGAVRFSLPRCRIRVRVGFGGRFEDAETSLQLVQLYPDDDEVTLTFNATHRAGRRVLAIDRVRIELASLELQEAA